MARQHSRKQRQHVALHRSEPRHISHLPWYIPISSATHASPVVPVAPPPSVSYSETMPYPSPSASAYPSSECNVSILIALHRCVRNVTGGTIASRWGGRPNSARKHGYGHHIINTPFHHVMSYRMSIPIEHSHSSTHITSLTCVTQFCVSVSPDTGMLTTPTHSSCCGLLECDVSDVER